MFYELEILLYNIVMTRTQTDRPKHKAVVLKIKIKQNLIIKLNYI